MRSLSLALLGLLAAVGSCDPVPLPKVVEFTHSGNGCPQGSSVARAGDFNGLTFTFGEFAAPAATTANCQVHFNAVGTAPGWQAGLRRVHVHAYEELGPGSEIEAIVQVFWSQDASNTRTARATISNTGGSVVRKTQTVTLDFGDNVLWSPCSSGNGYMGIFNANFRAVSSDGAYFGNRGDTKSIETFEWGWRRC